MAYTPPAYTITVQFNLYLVIEHPNILCVLCVNVLWVGVWKYAPPDPTLTLLARRFASRRV